MFGKDFERWCHEEPVIIEWVIPLGIGIDCGSAGDVLTSWLDEQNGDDIRRLFGADFFEDSGVGDDFDGSEVIELLSERDMGGLLVSMARPVKTKAGGGYSYSWGHTFTRTFYAETPEGITAKIKAWCAEIAKNERAIKETKPLNQL